MRIDGDDRGGGVSFFLVVVVVVVVVVVEGTDWLRLIFAPLPRRA